MRKATRPHLCGVCKKAGHNSRTCNKPYMSQPNTKHLQASPATVHNKTSGKLTFRNLVNQWDTYIENLSASNTNLNENPTPFPVKSGTGGYTAEDLAVLWELQNGKDGKQKKGTAGLTGEQIWGKESTQKLVELVQTIESHHPGVSTKEWRKFFSNFGANAKHDFLAAHKTAPRAPIYRQLGITESEEVSYLKNPKLTTHNTSAGDKPVLPLKLFPIFLKDTSEHVRQELVKKSGMPHELMKIIAEKGDFPTVLTLTHNSELPEEVVETIENRVTATINKQLNHIPHHSTQQTENEELVVQPFKVEKDTIWHADTNFSFIRINLARQPHLPRWVAEKYLTKLHPKEVGIELQVCENPNVDATLVTAKYEEKVKEVHNLERQLEEVMQTERTVGAQQNKSTQTMTILANERRQLTARISVKNGEIQKIVETGKLPLHINVETLKSLEHKTLKNTTNSHHAPFTLTPSPAESEAKVNEFANFIANVPLPPPELNKLYQRYKNSDLDIIIAGIMKNPRTPQTIAQDFLTHVAEKTDTEMNSPFPMRIAKMYAEKTLTQPLANS